MAVQIQLRNDTAANWTSANPTLAAGEVGVETDTEKMKLGDGSTAWNSLGYFEPSSITEVVAGTALTGGGTSGSVTLNVDESELEIGPNQVTGTAVVNDDARLTDARTPTSHASTHESGGSDEIEIAQSQVTGLTSDLDTRLKILQNNTLLTVGDTGADYTTINAALSFLSNFTPASGVGAEIKLLSGFIMKEQIIVNGINLGWITITSEDVQVDIDATEITETIGVGFPERYLMAVSNSGVGPVIGTLFAYDSNTTEDVDGILYEGTSKGTVLPGGGLINSPAWGLRLESSSGFFRETVWTGCYRGALINSSSSCEIRLSDASNCTVYGFSVERASSANLVNSIANDCGEEGFKAQHRSSINCAGVSAQRNGIYGIDIRDSSTCNARSANARTVDNEDNSSDLHVSQGAIVNASNLAGGLSQPANTITADGIIFQ